MKILELQKYAEDHGFDSLRFKFIGADNKEKTGRWVDAYFGFFKIEESDSNGFITVNQWLKLFGNDMFDFEIIEDKN
jgi:hypothetical protein